MGPGRSGQRHRGLAGVGPWKDSMPLATSSECPGKHTFISTRAFSSIPPAERAIGPDLESLVIEHQLDQDLQWIRRRRVRVQRRRERRGMLDLLQYFSPCQSSRRRPRPPERATACASRVHSRRRGCGRGGVVRVGEGFILRLAAEILLYAGIDALESCRE